MKLSLEAFYGRLPVVKCKGLCGAGVCNEAAPVGAMELEAVRAAAGGELPAGEPGGPCPLLGQHGECTVYEHRPFICRLYGAEPERNPLVPEPWRCPHGCVVEGELQIEELLGLLRDVGFFDGPRRSTNGTLNELLDELRADSWVFVRPDRGPGLALLARRESGVLEEMIVPLHDPGAEPGNT